MKTLDFPNETRSYAGIYALRSLSLQSPEESRTLRFERPKVRQEVRRAARVFRIQLDELNVTIHPGDDLNAVRELPSSTPPKYFIDDVEVDRETFDTEMGEKA